MSTSIRFLLLVLAGVFLLGARVVDRYASNASPINPNAVNPVMSDASYMARAGNQPTVATYNFEPVQTNLAYAEQQLRQHTPAVVPTTQRQHRAHLLDLLHAYWQAGVFPSNEAPDSQRHSCFIN
jgi:hypothetical protein